MELEVTLDNNPEIIPVSLREIAETKPKSPQLACPKTRHYRSVHLEVVLSYVCEDFRGRHV